MNMRRLFSIFSVMLLIMQGVVHGQNVAINTTGAAADPSAILDLNSGNNGTKGFLPPQVALTALNAAGPVTSPATGLVVYNTATAGTTPTNVVPGYYYWNGSTWVFINNASKSYMRLPFATISNANTNFFYTSAFTPASGYNWPSINGGVPTVLTPITANGTGGFYWGSLNNCGAMVSSDGVFSRISGCINTSTACTVTIYAWVYTFTDNSTASITGVQIGSTSVTVTTGSRNYLFEIPTPGTPFALTKGQIIMLWYYPSVNISNFQTSGTLEYSVNPQ
jgi:hypothetical protein